MIGCRIWSAAALGLLLAWPAGLGAKDKAKDKKAKWLELEVVGEQHSKCYLLSSGCTVNLFKDQPTVELFAYDYEHGGGTLEQRVMVSKDSQGAYHRQDYFRVGNQKVDSAPDITKECWEEAKTLPDPVGEFFRQ
jgi:hypothetical protein